MNTVSDSLRCLPLILGVAAFGAGRAPAQSPINMPPAASVVRIETTQPVAEESSTPFRRLALRGRFTVSRTGPTNNSLSVFVLYGGSATAGRDYEALPFLVTIRAGSLSTDLDVVARPDELAEPIEIVEAELSECPPLTVPPLGIPCRQVNIDPARSSARVFIREDGITTASLQITSPRDGARFKPGAAIPIQVTAIDLEGAITEVNFHDGDTWIGESRIAFTRQPPPGSPIQHQFDWTGAAVGGHVLNVRAVNAAGKPVLSPRVSIVVSADLPIVSIEATVPEAYEPSLTTRMRPGLFTLRRTGSTNGSLWVFLSYRGTAAAGQDYQELPGSVEIPPGATSVDLTVAPFEDSLVEGDETVVAQVQPDPSMGPIERYRVDLSQSAARVVIHDLTTPSSQPEVRIVATDPLAREGINSAGEVNTATFAIRRTGPTNEPLTVHFEVGGRALNGVDYQELHSPVVIPSGERGVRLTVIPIDDRLAEDAESVVIKLVPSPALNPLPGYALGTPHRAAAVILDNDRPRPRCVRLPDGLFNLCLAVNVHGCFRIEASDDLVRWERLCTIEPSEGAVDFIDPDGPDHARRFYRVMPDDCDP